MSKKQSKTNEFKNLATRQREAKTFHGVLAVIVDDCKQTIRRTESRLKSGSRIAKVDRARYEKTIRENESQLRKLEVRRQKYESCQRHRKVSVALKKRIKEMETTILKAEPGYDTYERDFVRCRKRELTELYEQVDRITNPPQPLATTNKMYKVGKAYPGQSITRSYDGHVWEVLKGHFEPLPRAKGERAKFKLVAALPEKCEYLQLKESHYTRTLEDIVNGAYGIVDELQGELQDAYDNMPDGLQESEAAEARAVAAEELESIVDYQPIVMPCLSSVRLVHYPPLHQSSRRDRASAAVAMMRDAVDAIQRFQGNGVKLKKAEQKLVDECVKTLKHHANAVDEVHFPGMFG